MPNFNNSTHLHLYTNLSFQFPNFKNKFNQLNINQFKYRVISIQVKLELDFTKMSQFKRLRVPRTCKREIISINHKLTNNRVGTRLRNPNYEF